MTKPAGKKPGRIKVSQQVRPGARTRVLIMVVGAGLWCSGGLWLIFHYFLKQPGEWGPEPHPLEPWWLRLHGAFVFAALWTAGAVGATHLVGGWMSGRRRWTGLLFACWIGLMIATGWMLIYAGDGGPWAFLSPTHWIAGLALPLAYATHRWLKKAD